MKLHLESILTARMVAGAQVPGAELKMGVKWSAWNDDKQAADTLYRIAGHRGVKPVTPSAAKKLSPEAAAYVAVASHKPEGEQKVSY